MLREKQRRVSGLRILGLSNSPASKYASLCVHVCWISSRLCCLAESSCQGPRLKTLTTRNLAKPRKKAAHGCWDCLTFAESCCVLWHVVTCSGMLWHAAACWPEVEPVLQSHL
eukprot:s102_g31.t1